METQKEHRLVAFIFPEMDGWGLGQVDESERPILAKKEDAAHPQYALCLCEVAAPRGEKNGRMIAEFNRRLPSTGSNLEGWQRIAESIQHAVSLPPLHKEDFSFLGFYGTDEDMENL